MSEEIKNVAIQQINLSYNAQEDRLLLKIGMSNGTELDLWLTRRIVKELLHLLDQSYQAPVLVADKQSAEAKQLEQTFSAQQAVAQHDYSQPYQQRASVNSGSVMVVQACQVTHSPNSIPQLEMRCTNGHSAQLAFTQELAMALVNMVQMAIRDAMWELAGVDTSGSSNVIASSRALH